MMIKPLTYSALLAAGGLCGLLNDITVIDVRSGRMYQNSHIDIDPTTDTVFAYTEEGAFWAFEYGETWWAYRMAE